ESGEVRKIDIPLRAARCLPLANRYEIARFVKGIDLDKACDLVSIRKRKTSGGSKWNVDFANFPGLTTAIRDAIGVNFGHSKYSGQYPDIRQVRIGSTRVVQELIRTGFPVERVYEADGETRKAKDEQA